MSALGQEQTYSGYALRAHALAAPTRRGKNGSPQIVTEVLVSAGRRGGRFLQSVGRDGGGDEKSIGGT